MTSRICVARIGAAHGVRGEVRLWTFTEDPLAVLQYGPLSTKDGARQIEVARARAAKDHLVATLKASGAEQLPVTWNHAVAVRSLPRFHRDPFDRILVAQAEQEGFRLVTHDALLARYGSFVHVV